MKIKIVILSIFLLGALPSIAQLKLPQVLKEAANTIKPGSPNQS